MVETLILIQRRRRPRLAEEEVINSWPDIFGLVTNHFSFINESTIILFRALQNYHNCFEHINAFLNSPSYIFNLFISIFFAERGEGRRIVAETANRRSIGRRVGEFAG